MGLFSSKLGNRIALGKTVGIVFGGVAFFIIPMTFIDISLLMRVAIWLWYISLGALVGLFGIMDKHPSLGFSFPFWIRGAFICAWMNFVLALFVYNDLASMMVGTFLDGYSPFFIIIEGLIFGFITDLITTKFIGDGKKLLK